MQENVPKTLVKHQLRIQRVGCYIRLLHGTNAAETDFHATRQRRGFDKAKYIARAAHNLNQ